MIKFARILKNAQTGNGPVIYWMYRDRRAYDNRALLFAQELALVRNVSLGVVVSLPIDSYFSLRQFDFMVSGLNETEQDLAMHNIPLAVCQNSTEKIAEFLQKQNAGILVTDFDPLRTKQNLNQELIEQIKMPFYEVDAHNIVPCWIASPKQEYGAYTIRPKIKKLLAEYLIDFPKLSIHPHEFADRWPDVDWQAVRKSGFIDQSVAPVSWLKPGGRQAYKLLENFIESYLPKYASLRNNPLAEAESMLSPYLHFGQLAPQRVALEILRNQHASYASDSFLEELIIRRELADNYCFYNKFYDSPEGFPGWAQESLMMHSQDKREYLYTVAELEQSLTHDKLWNAAQQQMVVTGKMHGYIRMYWAKKILEWMPNPFVAQQTAIYLNDKYELDGRDPNGYAGIAWCIGGVHDRAWGERPIFGKIRYMGEKGMRRKINVPGYIDKIDALIW